MKQKRLGKEVGLKKPYNYGPYNKYNDTEQWIRLTEGCPHQCPYCYEPEEQKIFKTPQIVRNLVKIMDMNLLSKPESLEIIRTLGKQRVRGKVVTYEMICGWDYRFLTQEIADEIRKARFHNLRISWDWFINDQHKIKDAIKKFQKTGYKPKEIMIMMLCNWRIPIEENLKKLDLCKVWNVKVGDCWFDGQKPPIQPVHWTAKEIKDFRSRIRKHNQLVNFGIDPEASRTTGKRQEHEK